MVACSGENLELFLLESNLPEVSLRRKGISLLNSSRLGGREKREFCFVGRPREKFFNLIHTVIFHRRAAKYLRKTPKGRVAQVRETSQEVDKSVGMTLGDLYLRQGNGCRHREMPESGSRS